jgi:hypothetical protein
LKNRGIPQLRFDPQGSVKTTLPETFPNFKKKERKRVLPYDCRTRKIFPEPWPP